MSSNRRRIRERILQVLYAQELTKDDIDDVLSRLLPRAEGGEASRVFGTALAKRVVENAKELDDLIKHQVEHWEFGRLAVIDKIILRMAICEFIHFDDIPPKVTINEAIEIAREYSTEKSDKFVNGVLDSILETLVKQGRIAKKGRGLLETRGRKSAS